MQGVRILVWFVQYPHSESPKVSNLVFQLYSKLYYACDYKFPWLMKVHSLLYSLGLSFFFLFGLIKFIPSKNLSV